MKKWENMSIHFIEHLAKKKNNEQLSQIDYAPKQKVIKFAPW